MKQANSVSFHAKRRSEQRWGGVVISVDEVERQLADDTAEIYERQNPVIWKLIVRVEGEKIPIVYNRRLKTIITVLPKEELERVQSELGMGFSSREESASFWTNLPSWRKHQIDREKRKIELQDPLFNAATVRRAQKRMERMDSLPPDVRLAVHEYGLEIVWEFWSRKIRSGNDIGILIEASRKAESAYSASLLPLFAHFGLRDEYGARYLATTARGEPAPKSPQQNRFRLNSTVNRKLVLVNAPPPPKEGE